MGFSERPYRRTVAPRTRYWARRWAWMSKKGRDFVLDGVEYGFSASLDELAAMEPRPRRPLAETMREVQQAIRGMRKAVKAGAVHRDRAHVRVRESAPNLRFPA